MATQRNTISTYPPCDNARVYPQCAVDSKEQEGAPSERPHVSPDGAPNHQRRRRSDTELACLYRLGQHINQSLDLDEVAAISLEIVMEAVQPDVALLFIQKGDRLILKKQSQRPGCGPAVSVPPHHVGQCLCGLAVVKRRPVYCLDIRDDPRCTMEECLRAGVISCVSLPLCCENRTIGVLALASQTQARDFSAQSRFLETMAAQIATALRNAQLHGEVRQRSLALAQTIKQLEHEIAERKAAMDQIRQLNAELEQRVAARTAELAGKNSELETFTYSVSHDLKAPLQTMEGYSRLLLEEYGQRLDEDGHLFLRSLRGGIDHMNRLIDGLLGYARMEHRPSTQRIMDLSDLVAEIVSKYQAEIQNRGIIIRLDLNARSVVADGEGLSVALRNLFDNAVKFSRKSAPPTITIGSRRSDSDLVVWVRDNGKGFDMRFHDRIFEIFQRLEASEEYTGTGVGLSIVRKAVQRMGGRCWAESEPERGATFYIEIPQ